MRFRNSLLGGDSEIEFDPPVQWTWTEHQSPPPPRPPTAIGLSDDDPLERIFATLDAMEGPELRKFLRRLADRYPLHTP